MDLYLCHLFGDALQFKRVFTTAYQVGDIEYGYQKHLPVWEAMDQNKYIKNFYSQQESLYHDITYSILQEIRLNRNEWRYHRKTGRRCVTRDEFLEHDNHFF